MYESSEPSPSSTTAIERVAKQRVKLLALKYANRETVGKLLNQLAFLNQFLLKNAPRITTAHLQAQLKANADLVRIRKVRETIVSRLSH